MREIKFRAWDEGNKKMFTNVQFITSGDAPNDWILFSAKEQKYDVENSKISFGNPYCRPQIHLIQFTGLLDKNGKEIYEGDIVKCIDHPTGAENVTNEVYFKDGSYRVKWSMITLGDFGTAWTEVIGNIYENPELIK